MRGAPASALSIFRQEGVASGFVDPIAQMRRKLKPSK
jgi:hypothetical protein